jgi:hypothetical protein
VLLAAALASYVNLRRGRADRRGAFRLGAFITVVIVLMWVVMPHVRSGADDQQRFFARSGIALFIGVVLYVMYLGLEPFVRRLWPSMLVGWTRTLNGGFHDPLVGRDALIGVAVGAVMALLALTPYVTAPFTHIQLPSPLLKDVSSLQGLRGAFLTVLQAVNNGLQNTLLNVFVYSFFRALFEWVTRTPFGRARRTVAGLLRMNASASDWAYVVLSVATAALLAFGSAPQAERYFAACASALTTLILLLVLLRAGIFAMAVTTFTASLLERMPMRLSPDALYAHGSWIAVMLLLGLAVYGFRTATRTGARI